MGKSTIYTKSMVDNTICSRLVLVLDSSGSMESQKKDVIGGVNETIKQQRLMNSNIHNIYFNVITFSHQVSTPTNHTLLNVPFLTANDYKTTGSTALFDAIGLTIERYKDEHNLIFLIMTDGEENASCHYTYNQIVKMIDDKKSKQNWNFIYLSENIETFKQGEKIGLSSKSMNCNNIMTSKNGLGSTLGNFTCQQAICKMIHGEKNVKI